MHDGLKPIMCSEFFVDVVEMVAERLVMPKILGDFAVASVEESAKKSLVIVGETDGACPMPFPSDIATICLVAAYCLEVPPSASFL